MRLTNLPGDIIHRLHKDDQGAFNLVYRTFYQAIFFLVNKMVDNATEAEDITQDTFIKFWNRRYKFNTPENIQGFIYITAANAARDYLKLRKGREADHKIIRHISTDEVNIENQIIKADLFRQVLLSLGSLPKTQKLVFEKIFVENLTYKEVEEELDMTPTAVRMNKSLAIKHLRNIFGANSFLVLFMTCLTALTAFLR